ncbi:hypothetical protein [Lentzea jiangxiensis]|uniref:hypothetical protein n=1 Tax=Lentzea jiangxiensis TaxID=641025 RepID=UPI001FE23D7F|nr:hypothetical protein [Lentzea jiangxiensis]
MLRRADSSLTEGKRYAKIETGFAWLRLVGAVLVVVEHSFPLIDPSRIGMFPKSWNLSPGYFALMAFFAMSGYQIADSWHRDRRGGATCSSGPCASGRPCSWSS